MKFSAVILAFACVAVACAFAAPLTEAQFEHVFTRFVEQYDKQYPTNAFFSRYNIFKANLNTIIAHNAKGLSYTMAMNEFGDLTGEEFSVRMGLKKQQKPLARSSSSSFSKLADELAGLGLGSLGLGFNTENESAGFRFAGGAIDDVKDWREEGAVNAIKNQGQCGSCYAFSASAAIEGATKIKTGKLPNLSESQIIDCTREYGNEGCCGGFMENVYNYVMAKGGLCSTKDYPYKPIDGKCADKSCKPVATITGFKKAPRDSDSALSYLATQSVLAVAIEAGTDFQFYSSGVFDAPCGKNLNHAVNVVGVNTAAAQPYFIVRNSWGTSWGEKGYIRMAAGKNICGIASDASYVTV